jgi:hypothetical protein
LRDTGVPLVDAVSLARRAARESPFPTFPRYGIHWNPWGAHGTVAAALNLIAEQFGEPRPTLTASSVTMVDEDPDIVETRADHMGIYRGPREESVPSVRFTLGAWGGHRRATIVGDSFAAAMIEVLSDAHAFTSIERFNYLTEFHESYPGGRRAENYGVDEIDWARDIFGSQVVILEINEMLGLPPFARTFVKETLKRMPSASYADSSTPR